MGNCRLQAKVSLARYGLVGVDCRKSDQTHSYGIDMKTTLYLVGNMTVTIMALPSIFHANKSAFEHAQNAQPDLVNAQSIIRAFPLHSYIL